MAQRISRAKQQVRAAGARFAPPEAADRGPRLRAVQQVLYLIFNEGYVASAGETLQRLDLAAEGIRLTRLLRRLQPDDAESAGLIALVLLTHARRAARVTPDGALVPLAEQDRARWDRPLIAEGAAHIARTLATTRALGPYQLQAAIAAVHSEAASVADTDWAEILAACTSCLPRCHPARSSPSGRRSPSPWSTARRPAWPRPTNSPACSPGTTGSTRSADTCSTCSGDHAAALTAYRTAARYATNAAEKRYLDLLSRR